MDIKIISIEPTGTLAEAEAFHVDGLATRFVQYVNNNKLAGDLCMAVPCDRPDMEEYEESPDMEGYEDFLKRDTAFFSENDIPLSAHRHPRWIDQLVPVMFQAHFHGTDPFDEQDDGLTGVRRRTRVRVRRKAREHFATCAEQVFRAQHRTALFMLFVIGRKFRFLRWDRSVVVVTPTIDYVSEPQLLCEFFWRLSLQTDETLGIDPSAVRLRPGDHDYALMDQYGVQLATDLATGERVLEPEALHVKTTVFKYVRLMFRESVQRPGWARYRLEVPHGNEVRYFLVGSPIIYDFEMAGRGTRGYVALDCATRRFVWLKDAWRVHSALVNVEGATLAELNAKQVRNVPTLLYHGDIRGQVASTSRLQPENLATTPVSDSSPLDSPPLSSSKKRAAVSGSLPARPHKRLRGEDGANSVAKADFEYRHYRLVQKEVAMPLSEFRDGRQLVAIILDCVLTHQDAVVKAKILHCDISEGNILIYPKIVYEPKDNNMKITWTSLLVDWELAQPIAEDIEYADLPHTRVGTWQFMSIGMLTGASKQPSVSDDLESFLYVLLHHGVRYLQSNCNLVQYFFSNFFDFIRPGDNLASSAFFSPKYHAVQNNGYITCNGVGSDWRNRLLFGSPLDEVFSRLLPCFKARYNVLAYEKWKAKHLDQPPEPEPESDPEPKPQPPSESDEESASTWEVPLSSDIEGLPQDPAMLKHLESLKKKRRAQPPPREPPSAEEFQYAAYVGTHDMTIRILEYVYSHRSEWSSSDKIGDRLVGPEEEIRSDSSQQVKPPAVVALEIPPAGPSSIKQSGTTVKPVGDCTGESTRGTMRATGARSALGVLQWQTMKDL
ncbi:hypothetical protein C8Q79DRAFT_286174 [Trametes meyenii]|nr:hypothetical protein C8Q79DRAFT_286174 [Trametes meyenii]